mmetsp:Transcript_7820/g.10730  ORF Transcript_7820/g.10730 Transcript_7820/m.10730 type:complete len:209 (+) Transcript_7820:335-961(+)|eukprot:CAMPEP_0185261512 /NCGR_PEP_ID=MMETSP1359-20130426/9888_1 /TAXON_ID=552665 /ORGANISM="Bigelowiella longifila, Strain CCMP242" /LENGTH=208 /DNA_ID=CAMNT_0027848165 /DNA_START=319 /DNA_END=945 /DNA_ORIENTATION=+
MLATITSNDFQTCSRGDHIKHRKDERVCDADEGEDGGGVRGCRASPAFPLPPRALLLACREEPDESQSPEYVGRRDEQGVLRHAGVGGAVVVLLVDVRKGEGVHHLRPHEATERDEAVGHGDDELVAGGLEVHGRDLDDRHRDENLGEALCKALRPVDHEREPPVPEVGEDWDEPQHVQGCDEARCHQLCPAPVHASQMALEDPHTDR